MQLIFWFNHLPFAHGALFLFLSIPFHLLSFHSHGVEFRERTKSNGFISKQPPGPRKLPIIGNVHQLASSLPHHRLRDLAKRYGPLMHLQLGEVSTIVVSSPEFAREFMKTNDITFASRPEILASQIIGYDSTNISFSPYRDYWRQIRKICMLELLSSKRVQSFKPVREEVMKDLIKWISSKAGAPINLTEKVFSSSYTMTSKGAFGKKCREQDRFETAVQQSIELAAGLNPSDLYPSNKLLYVIGRMGAQRLHKEVDRILGDIVDEHMKSLRTAKIGVKEVNEDLVDVLLKYEGHGGLGFHLTADNIKAVILDLYAAGSETTATIVYPLIRSAQLLHHIQEDAPPETISKDKEETENPEYYVWLNNDGLLTSWLLGTMNEDSLSLVVGSNSAYEIWKCLEEHYLASTKEQELQLKGQLTIKRGSNESLEAFLKKFKNTCDSLAAINKPLDDLDKVFHLSRVVGSRYQPYNLAVLSKAPYPTFRQYILGLENTERDLNAEEEEEKNSAQNYGQVFIVQRGRGNRGRGRRSFNSRGRGFIQASNYNNHWSGNNRPVVTNNNPQPYQGNLQQKNQPKTQSSKGENTCQICGIYGHIAIKCWYRFDHAYQSEDLPQALAAVSLSEDKDPSFYADSAASDHMTSDKGNLYSKLPYNGNRKDPKTQQILAKGSRKGQLYALDEEAQEKCEINGYEIPFKSKVLINGWAIGRDPSLWNDAERFYPERFLGISIDFKGTNFEYIPFGAGRRMCPGMASGLVSVEFILALLLYHFDWKLPNGIHHQDLDMSESFGVTAQRKYDLFAIPSPHQPSLE
ncbi:hypothetical protein SLEP1_g29686 [Rubroshorea leprosula]|uniref:Cytochrome P450 n=1 Tax=Rubroshorea leprosula TaxID=152421 RepID=A0AAV5K887_9ROSI|nr:hypothetical protein SLEP1_g29686 [Rubroshorea leprosula]